MSTQTHELPTQDQISQIVATAISNSQQFRECLYQTFLTTNLENFHIHSTGIENGVSNTIVILTLTTNENIAHSSPQASLDFILKITPPSTSSHYNFKTLNEVHIMKFLSENIPQFKSPTIYWYSTLLGMEYILMEKCRGVALNLIYEDLNNEVRQSLISQISHLRGILSEFKYIPQNKEGIEFENLFGGILDIKLIQNKTALVTVGANSDGDGPFESFTDYLIANFTKRIKDMEKDDRVVPHKHNFEELVEKLKTQQQTISPDLYQLCHIDMTPNNVIVDPSNFEITGIIDWEWGVMTIIDQDINELLTWTRNEEEISFLKEHLKKDFIQVKNDPSSFWKGFEERKQLFLALDWAIRLSGYKSWFKDPTEAEEFIERAIKNTDLFFKELKDFNVKDLDVQSC